MNNYISLLLLLFLPATLFCQESVLTQDGFIALAAPTIQFENRFFEKETKVVLAFRMEGARIHYTLDSSPVTQSSPIYSEPLFFRSSTSLHYKAFHPDYLPSETNVQQFLKIKPFPSNTKVLLLTPSTAPYDKANGQALIDLKSGQKDFSSDTSWLGFQNKAVTIRFELPSARKINTLKIALLENQSSWIFLPNRILVEAQDGYSYSENFPNVAEKHKSDFRYIALSLPPFVSDWIELTFNCLPSIPEWHPGKGSVPWLFFDEIIME